MHFFFFNDTATTEIYTLSLHDALPIYPGNPIINTRSFGENPERVAKFVGEFVRGVQENGGLATAKHFPGHGGTAADSHIYLPRIRPDHARLDNLELVPFRPATSFQLAPTI